MGTSLSSLKKCEEDDKNLLKKRSRDSFDDTDKSSKMKIFPWDPFIVTHWDTDLLIPMNSLSKLQQLSERVESLDVFPSIMHSYKLIRNDFEANVKSILQQSPISPEFKKDVLDDLVESTAHKLELLTATTYVISNWLINARTRKWRPAIVKAHQLARPAE